MSISIQPEPVEEVTPTWGEALTVVRRRSGRTLTEVAQLVSQFAPTSVMSLQRLEGLEAPPTNLRMRGVAVAALLAYGWTDLEAFGLSLEDTPTAWDRKRLSRIGSRRPKRSRRRPPTNTQNP